MTCFLTHGVDYRVTIARGTLCISYIGRHRSKLLPCMLFSWTAAFAGGNTLCKHYVYRKKHCRARCLQHFLTQCSERIDIRVKYHV